MLKKQKNMPTVILSILPDVNSTTIAISEDYNIVYQCDIDHSKCDFILLDNIIEQLPFRRDAIIYQLRNDNINIKDINYVVSEGGLLKPCESGVYHVDKNMIGDLIDAIGGCDIINMGGLLAFTIANTLRIKSLVVDPASVDERSEISSFSPHPAIKKKSLFHALIHKYLSRKYAKSISKRYEDLNLIFCHVSDKSVSIAAHKKSKIIDVNQAYMGFGPMGFCEAGSVPTSALYDMLFVKHYSKDEIYHLLKQKATFFTYLGTNSVDDIMRSSKDNKKTKLILDVMAYQISKEIASHYVSLDAEIDAIILSGKIFSHNRFLKYIYKRIETLAPITIYKEDCRIEALIFNVLDCIASKGNFLSYG